MDGGGRVASKAEEYRQHAQECLDAAQRIQNAEQRTILLQIAQRWMHLAEKEDAAEAAQQQQLKDDKEYAASVVPQFEFSGVVEWTNIGG
jgi:hypothetical protein